jgi:hypothetical protein
MRVSALIYETFEPLCIDALKRHSDDVRAYVVLYFPARCHPRPILTKFRKNPPLGFVQPSSGRCAIAIDHNHAVLVQSPKLDELVHLANDATKVAKKATTVEHY